MILTVLFFWICLFLLTLVFVLQWLQLGASSAGGEFCEWVQVETDAHTTHCKYQIKPDSSQWFSAACAAAVTHRNHFFRLYQQITPSESKVKFRQATVNRCRSALEAAKLAYTNKTGLLTNC